MSKAMELSNAFGYLFAEEVTFLQTLAYKIPKGGVCVNIGAGPGTSSLAILETRPDLTPTFYTVDISTGGPLGGLQNEVNAFNNAGLTVPNQVLGDSKEVGKTWNKQIDYLFIDGDHSWDGAKGDIDAWFPHLKPGAIVAFHDYDSVNWGDIKRLVDYTMKTRVQIGVFRTLAAYYNWQQKPETEKAAE